MPRVTQQEILDVCKKYTWKLSWKDQVIRTVDSNRCPLQIWTGRKQGYLDEARRLGATAQTMSRFICASDRVPAKPDLLRAGKLRERMLKEFKIKR